jgi:tRNA dimethylallyltransferase
MGPAILHERLAHRAPWAAAAIDPGDRHRIARAHALLDIGELEPPEGPSRLWTTDTRHPTRLVALVRERSDLYARIDARVLEMVAAGAVEEVRAAQAAGASETARKALGFDELLTGDVAGMQRRTRNFAKRQLTWLRKLSGVEVIDVTGRDPAAVAAELLATPAPAAP